MPLRPELVIDCIPDVHFSKHIIPPLLPQISQTHYDLLLSEISTERRFTNSESSTGAIKAQGLIAKNQGTEDIYSDLNESAKCVPICIDEVMVWQSLQMALIKSDLDFWWKRWSNSKYRAKALSLARRFFVERESWMLKQIRSLLETVSGPDKRPVRALLLIGAGHAPALSNSLVDWCQFNYLVDFKTTKAALLENLKMVGSALKSKDSSSKIKWEQVQTFNDIRYQAALLFLLELGAPKDKAEELLSWLAPKDLNAERFVEWHHKNGLMASKIEYKNNKMNGSSIYYYSNGRIRARCAYKDDLQDGPKEYFLENGEYHSKVSYKENQLQGLCVWFENGQKLTEAYYNYGKREGLCRGYYPSGQLQLEAEYQAGQQHGYSKGYFKSGSIKWEGSYHEGKKHGSMKHYNEDGSLQSEVFYQQGEDVGKPSAGDSVTRD